MEENIVEFRMTSLVLSFSQVRLRVTRRFGLLPGHPSGHCAISGRSHRALPQLQGAGQRSPLLSPHGAVLVAGGSDGPVACCPVPEHSAQTVLQGGGETGDEAETVGGQICGVAGGAKH